MKLFRYIFLLVCWLFQKGDFESICTSPSLPYKTKTNNDCANFTKICMKTDDAQCRNFQDICAQCPSFNHSAWNDLKNEMNQKFLLIDELKNEMKNTCSKEGLIIVYVLIAILLILHITVLAYYCYKKKNRNSTNSNNSGTVPYTSVPGGPQSENNAGNLGNNGQNEETNSPQIHIRTNETTNNKNLQFDSYKNSISYSAIPQNSPRIPHQRSDIMKSPSVNTIQIDTELSEIQQMNAKMGNKIALLKKSLESSINSSHTFHSRSVPVSPDINLSIGESDENIKPSARNSLVSTKLSFDQKNSLFSNSPNQSPRDSQEDKYFSLEVWKNTESQNGSQIDLEKT